MQSELNSDNRVRISLGEKTRNAIVWEGVQGNKCRITCTKKCFQYWRWYYNFILHMSIVSYKNNSESHNYGVTSGFGPVWDWEEKQFQPVEFAFLKQAKLFPHKKSVFQLALQV